MDEPDESEEEEITAVHEEEEAGDEDEREENGETDEFGIGPRLRSDICAAFTLLDHDGDGRISPRTLQDVVVALGREPTKENLDEIMAHCPSDEGDDGGCKSGMDFCSFYRYLGKQLVDTDDAVKLRNALDVFGSVSRMDNPVPTGMTDLAELRHYLKHRGMKLTDDEMDYLWEEENYWMLNEKQIETDYLVKKILDKNND